MKLSYLILILWVFGFSSCYQGPTKQLLTRAFCACDCCKSVGQQCYKHPDLEDDINCKNFECSEDFCQLIRNEECKLACFCRKCNNKLPESEKSKCLLRQDGEIPQRCNCDQFTDEDMDCSKRTIPIDAPDVSQETGEEEKMKKMQDDARCAVSCLCKVCIKSLPEEMTHKCSNQNSEGCNCKDTKCPTAEDVERYKRIKESVDGFKQAQMLDSEENQQAATKFNEEMKDQIAAGEVKPMTPDKVHQAKCQLQCICNKCQDESIEMKKRCESFLLEAVAGCPVCNDSETRCPSEKDVKENCALVCICKKCLNHRDMTPGLADACKNMYKDEENVCGCDTKDVDCNVIGKLRSLIDEKYREAKKNKDAMDLNKTGKFKKKHKMWDEL